MRQGNSIGRVAAVALALLAAGGAQAAEKWIVFEGKSGPGKGKHIVLLSGDEEYRSEEAMPMLAKILAEHHGFKCTVLFSQGDDGIVDPNNQGNIPGTEALNDADLMMIFWRFRKPKNEQMKNINDYLMAGKPVIGMRTSTHAFNGLKGEWEHYNFRYKGSKAKWKEGFGRFILGETWINHHGGHKSESTVGVVAPEAKGHPITRGIEKKGAVWGATDVYGVRLPLPGDSKHIVLGQVTKRKGPKKNDAWFGLSPEDDEPNEKKNNPMMPVSWTKSYQLDGGKKGKVFNTTMGASNDLTSAGTRRMIVNGVYWCVGLEDKIPAGGTKVDLVGKNDVTAYSFKRGDYWKKQGKKPADYK
jgi:type 1 glutamine amidotransferase